MPIFDPEILADWAEGEWKNGVPERAGGFSQDSRTIRPGEVFVALETEHRDGHEFAEDARCRGACAVLAGRRLDSCPLPQLVVPDPLGALQRMAAAHRRRFDGPVIGISGSCGKTTTKDLLAELLAFRGPVLKTAGNLNNHIGVPLTLLRLDPEFHRVAVIEAGINRPGEMADLAHIIGPTDALITTVAPVHLERLGTLEGVASEKAELLRALPPWGRAVFPERCLAFPEFRFLSAAAYVVRDEEEYQGAADVAMNRFYPRPPAGSVRTNGRLTWRRGREGDLAVLRVRFPGEDKECVFPALGLSRGMAENAAVAIAVARELGADEDAVRESLLQWEPGACRGEVFELGESVYYLDCYNSNPVALVDALEAFEETVPENLPRLFVLGAMEELGERAEDYHVEALQSLMLREGDYVFLLGSHAEAMARGLAEAGNDPESWTIAASREVVARALAEFRGAVFIKGSRRYRLEELWQEVKAKSCVGKGAPC